MSLLQSLKLQMSLHHNTIIGYISICLIHLQSTPVPRDRDSEKCIDACLGWNIIRLGPVVERWGNKVYVSTEYDNINSARTSAIDKLWYTPSLGRLGISPFPPTPCLVGHRYRTRKCHYQTRQPRTSTAIMSSPASSRRRGCNGTPARVLDSRLRRRHADSRS